MKLVLLSKDVNAQIKKFIISYKEMECADQNLRLFSIKQGEEGRKMRGIRYFNHTNKKIDGLNKSFLAFSFFWVCQPIPSKDIEKPHNQIRKSKNLIQVKEILKYKQHFNFYRRNIKHET